MPSYKVKKFRGDSYLVTVKITNEGVNVDITDWTFFYTVKEKITDTDNEAVISKTLPPGEHLNPTAGETLFTIEAGETDELFGEYYYDIQYKKPDTDSIKTVVRDTIVFEEDVTIRVS